MTKDPKKVGVTDAQKQVYDNVCKRLIEGQPEATNYKLCYNQTDPWASCSVSERQKSMATLEERIQALEQENAARKKTEELLTIAVRALVSKEAFEKLQEAVERSQEQNNKLFDVLNNHNIFTNGRLGDIQNQLVELDGKIAGQQTETRQIQNQLIELDGKIVGQQTEMRQRFTQVETTQAALDGKLVGLQSEVRQRFTQVETTQAALDGKLVGLQSEVRQRFTEQGSQIAELDSKVTGLQTTQVNLQTTQTEHTTLLQQILARLPEKP